MPKTMTFDRNETALLRKLLATELKKAQNTVNRLGGDPNISSTVESDHRVAKIRQAETHRNRVAKLFQEANLPVMVERTNLMSGEKYMEAEDTPLSCSPASETYWSM